MGYIFKRSTLPTGKDMLLRFKATPNNEPAQTICCLGKVSKKKDADSKINYQTLSEKIQELLGNKNAN